LKVLSQYPQFCTHGIPRTKLGLALINTFYIRTLTLSSSCFSKQNWHYF